MATCCSILTNHDGAAGIFSDAEVIFETYATDDTVTRYLMWTPHRTQDTVLEFVHERMRRIETGEEITWAITLPGDGSAIAMIGGSGSPRSDERG